MRVRVLASLLGFLLLSGVARVSAAQPTPKDKDKADQLFREGRMATARGEHARACALFAESQRLDPTAGTLLNLADCSENLGDLWAARTHLLAALDRLKASDDRVPLAKERVARLGAKLPKLRLLLPASIPAGARLELNGKEIALDGELELVLPAGGHDLAAISEDAQRKVLRVQLEQGRTLELAVTWPAPPAAPPTAAPPSASAAAPAASTGPLATAPTPLPTGESGGSWRRPAGFTLGGVGVASFVGAAVVALVLIPGKQQLVDENCGSRAGFSDPKACNARGASAAQEGRTWARVFNLGLGLGALGLGAGAYLVLSAPAPGGRAGATSLGLGGRF
jgi:hypothetical protein